MNRLKSSSNCSLTNLSLCICELEFESFHFDNAIPPSWLEFRQDPHSPGGEDWIHTIFFTDLVWWGK